MKHLPNIVGALLGLAFITFGLMYFLKMMPDQPPPPPDSAVAKFMGAFATTGYLDFVKALEILGGLLVAIPRTRNFGLLILGPILINILGRVNVNLPIGETRVNGENASHPATL